MFCSAMPQLNRRSAKPASASFFVVVEPVRSASTATTGKTLVRQLGQRGAVCGARGTFDLGTALRSPA